MTVNSRITEWLPALLARDHERAWDRFLAEYAGLILQVVHLFERDQDRIDDCFVFVCEHLKLNELKRLRRFDPDGSASFSTWLRAVVRNLCLDWRRKHFGRPRLYRSIARLPDLEREIFRCIHQQGLSENETFHTLKALFPALTRVHLADGLTHVEQALTSRQEWLLTMSRPRLKSLTGSSGEHPDEGPEKEIPSPELDPETRASQREQLEILRQALGRLPTQQRLLIRLRFEQDLSLDQIARLTRLTSVVRVQRELAKAVQTLRSELRSQSSGSVSVKDS